MVSALVIDHSLLYMVYTVIVLLHTVDCFYWL